MRGIKVTAFALLLLLSSGCGDPSGPDSSTSTVDPLIAVEDASGFSRESPPNQNVYEICRTNGSAGLANQLGLDPTLYPDGFPDVDTARAYTDRVAAMETEEARLEVYVSCLFGFAATN